MRTQSLRIGLTNTRLTALVGCGTYLLAQNDSGGVFLSRDNGATWTVARSAIGRDSKGGAGDFVQSKKLVILK